MYLTENMIWLSLFPISCQQLVGLRQLMQGGMTSPKAPLGNNFRPPHPVHYRPVRTNINFRDAKDVSFQPANDTYHWRSTLAFSNFGLSGSGEVLFFFAPINGSVFFWYVFFECHKLQAEHDNQPNSKMEVAKEKQEYKERGTQCE
jgi:hypothetical protein